ncbi:flagellin [Caldifermentibacillus hisashii]|uniref:flagellin N-terminal helical domain-containing protein n=1 Tax=Caldifermentibacillus hisashii TaxID=996558 RepID=UPI00399C8ED0
MEKLSSGLRINKAGDDAAGLAISEKMRGQIRGLDMAAKNAQDGISLIQTAEGALNETHSILQRMRELSVQASNDTNTAADREEIQKEISQLIEEIDRIANTTEFNTKKLLNGAAGLDAKSNNTAVSVVGGSDTVKAGGRLVLTGVTGASSASTTAASGNLGSGDVTINGTTISFETAPTSVDDIVSKINSVSGQTGVQAQKEADGNLTVKTIDTGSDASMVISGLDVVAGTTSIFDTTGKSGSDATVTIDQGTTGVDPTAFTAKGNSITFTDGDYKGLTINVASGTSSASATIDINANNALSFQIGANEGQDMSISINNMNSSSLGIDNINVTSATSAKAAITTINDAIEKVSSERSKLGAYQNRLDHTINNLSTSSENLTAAESRIRDVDYALAA